MLLFDWILLLLFAAVVLANLAERLAVPYPSLLAIAGACLAFLPFGPRIAIEPELALALFVAPALLDAAFDTSPRDLARNVIPIASLAVIAVIITTAAVAYFGWRTAGLPLGAAIALGAVVAPPDAVAASEVLAPAAHPATRVGLVLRGESLLNDATALFIYRGAVAAAVGSFSFIRDTPFLLLAAAGSLLAGYLLARLYLLVTAQVRDAPSSTVLQFVATFGVWILSERLTLSPIITVVVYAMTPARAAPWASGTTAAHQLLRRVGDWRLRCQRARLRVDGPAGAAHHRTALAGGVVEVAVRCPGRARAGDRSAHRLDTRLPLLCPRRGRAPQPAVGA